MPGSGTAAGGMASTSDAAAADMVPPAASGTAAGSTAPTSGTAASTVATSDGPALLSSGMEAGGVSPLVDATAGETTRATMTSKEVQRVANDLPPLRHAELASVTAFMRAALRARARYGWSRRLLAAATVTILEKAGLSVLEGHEEAMINAVSDAQYARALLVATHGQQVEATLQAALHRRAPERAAPRTILDDFEGPAYALVLLGMAEDSVKEAFLHKLQPAVRDVAMATIGHRRLSLDEFVQALRERWPMATPAPRKKGGSKWCAEHKWCKHTTAECWGTGRPLGKPPGKPKRPAKPPGEDDRRCFECGAVGHVRANCPNLKNKMPSNYVVLSNMSLDEPARPGLITFPAKVGESVLTALYDSGSEASFINKNLVEQEGLTFEPCELHVRLGAEGMSATVKEKTTTVVKAGQKRADLTLYHLRSEFDMIIGVHDAAKLGICVSGLPVDKPEDLAYEVLEEMMPPCTADKLIDPALREIMMNIILPAIEENQKLPLNAVCTHDNCVFAIDTGNHPPVYIPQYPIPCKYKDKVIERVNEWAEKDYIMRAPQDSRWNHPLLPQPKDSQGEVKKDDIRLCDDVRGLNRITPAMTNYLPIIDELLAKLARFTIASSLDGSDAYHKITIRECDRVKTTFTDPLGRKWMWKVMFFGLKNAPPFFQIFMLRILDEFIEQIASYLDDVMPFTEGELNEQTVTVHANLVCMCIRKLTQNKFRLRIEKCIFGALRLRVLGFVLEHNRKMVDRTKVAKILDIPRPSTGKQLEAWIGAINYLRSHIPLLSPLLAPLQKLRKLRKISNEAWAGEPEAAFRTVRDILSSAPAIEQVDYSHPLLLAVDASQFGVGWVLYQEYGDRPHLVHIGSKALRGAQVDYSASKRELLGILYAVSAAHDWLFGVEFTVFCDHRPLVDIQAKNAISSRVMRDWWQTLSQYSFKIVHRPGILNVLPDALSRVYSRAQWCSKEVSKNSDITNDAFLVNMNGPPDIPVPWDDDDKVEEALWDEEEGVPSRKPTGKLEIDDTDPTFLKRSFKDWLKNKAEKKTIENPVQQSEYLSKIHKDSHGGAEAMFRTVWRNGLYWPELRDQCKQIAEACNICLRHAVQKVGFHPLKPIVCKEPGDHVAIDYAGKFITSAEGYNYVMVIVDIASRFVILRPVKSRLETEAAKVLFQVFADYGVPRVLQSDNDACFTGKVLKVLREKLDFIHRYSAPFNPVQNGTPEKFVDLSKRKLKRFMHGEIRHWDTFLPAVQIALNSTISPRHKSTPFAVMFGRQQNKFSDFTGEPVPPENEKELVQRVQRIHNNVHEALYVSSKEYANKYAKSNDKQRTVVEEEIPAGTVVMIKNEKKNTAFDESFYGPFIVLRKAPAGYELFNEALLEVHPTIVPLNKMQVLEYDESKLILREAGRATLVMQKILRHRGPFMKREYLVKFVDNSTKWVPYDNFPSSFLIQRYWRDHDKKM